MPSTLRAAPKTGLDIDRKSHTIRFTRDVDATPAEIFAAWTSPEHVSAWWDPAGRVPDRSEAGGRFQIRRAEPSRDAFRRRLS
jgi:uncharacterized protein YndB with AHSA1/START domain